MSFSMFAFITIIAIVGGFVKLYIFGDFSFKQTCISIFAIIIGFFIMDCNQYFNIKINHKIHPLLNIIGTCVIILGAVISLFFIKNNKNDDEN